MAKGPLAVRWGDPPSLHPQAGAAVRTTVEVENAGSVPWRAGINVAYHWLDRRGNPIVWDGLRTPFPHPVAPGSTSSNVARSTTVWRSRKRRVTARR